MAVQLINIGNVANDGTGDDLREAMIKINTNFEELDLRDDEQTTAKNLGDTGEGLFLRRNVYDLEFKKIVGGDNITLTVTDNNITIANNLSGITQSDVADDNYVTKQFDFADARILYNNAYNTVNDLPLASSYHGMFAHVHTTGGAYFSHAGDWIELANKNETFAEVAADLTPQLGGDLDAQANNLLNVGTITTTGINGPVTGNVTGDLTGNVTGLVHGIDIRTIAGDDQADFGAINPVIENLLQYVIINTDIDWGSINNPNSAVFDLGAIAV